MKALVKYQFYLMTSLAAVLFIVGTALSDDLTDISTETTKQMAKKTTIMILGSPHLAGWDGVEVDDMRTPKRQVELQQLVEQLIRFKPTKIAVEADTRWDAELQAEYNAYLKDDFQLERHEIHQVGFRLAKQMGHLKIYCVDYFPSRKDDPIFGDDFNWDLTDYHKFAKTHGQEHLLSLPSNEEALGATDNLVTERIIDMYTRLNQPEWIRSIHLEFLRYSRIGLDDEYPGANWFGHQWYPRNLKTFVNLTRITESPDDRILLIIGAAHTFLIQQFLEDSEDYIIESPLRYLKTEDANLMKHQTKPTIMILGSSHLANPGMDGSNPKIDDVLAPKRQREIKQLVEQLKAFNPTKIALEVDFSRNAEINAEYQGYLKGTYQLTRGEGNQIGYRLAKQLGHSKVYCVDYFRSSKENPIFKGGIDSDLIDRGAFAKAHNQRHLFGSHPGSPGKVTRDEDGTVWIEPEEYEPVTDMYMRLNQPERSRASQRAYLHDARIGLGDQYPGANWLAHIWYARNLKAFVNLTRITESADDRILLIIGAGHVYLIQQFLEESGDYIVESPLKYLEVGAMEAP